MLGKKADVMRILNEIQEKNRVSELKENSESQEILMQTVRLNLNIVQKKVFVLSQLSLKISFVYFFRKLIMYL